MSDAYNIIDLLDSTGSGEAEFAERTSLPVKHFHFRENPFVDSVNPSFFFRTEAHEEAYIKMKKCIEEHVAIGLTTALSGTGKTLLTQILLTELAPEDFEPILVLAYPGLTRTGLLREIALEMGIENIPTRAPLHWIMNAVQTRIVQLHHEGRKLVIIIDECHFLGVEPLQMVRTLSNIELPQKKLVTILLFGEQAFLTKMNKPEYASIFNRMFIRSQLRPLTREETQQYIKFRCLVSGGSASIFSADFYNAIHERSGGIPREINRLCHSALYEAAKSGAKVVQALEIES
jgi:type II secretory pathway predicted ATPase ExeA